MDTFDLRLALQSHSAAVKENQAKLRFLQVPLGLSVTQLLVEVGHSEAAVVTANRKASVWGLMFPLQRPNGKLCIQGWVILLGKEKQGGMIGM